MSITPKQVDSNSILNEMNANLYRYEQLSTEQLEAMRKMEHVFRRLKMRMHKVMNISFLKVIRLTFLRKIRTESIAYTSVHIL